MPPRRAQRRRRPRALKFGGRRGNRNRAPLRAMSSINFVEQLVPDKMYTKLKYCDYITMDPGAAGINAVHVFSCGSIHDPDISGIGHQPMAHDSAASLYHHYTVLGAKMKATFFAPATGAGDQTTGICGVALRASTTSDNDPRVYAEDKDTNYKAISNYTAGQATQVVTKQYTNYKFFGLKDAKASIGDDRFTTSFGSIPNESAYFQLFISTVDGSTDMGACKVFVEIEYYVALTERKALALS